jgi:NADP-dependent 3-hydroxy acid dehydrogenase YdfG
VADLASILDMAWGRDMVHPDAGSHVGGAVPEGNADAWDRMQNLNVSAMCRPVHAVGVRVTPPGAVVLDLPAGADL